MIYHTMFVFKSLVEITEAVNNRFILVIKHEKCISMAPELECEPERNDRIVVLRIST